jgi:integrase
MGQKKSAVQDDFYIFPVGDVYYVKFRDPITREVQSKRSTGYRNKTAARQWAQEEWDRRSAIAGLTDMIFYDYASQFFDGDDCPHAILRRANGDHLGIKTQRAYRLDLENHILKDPICQKKIAEIRRSDSMAFRDRLIVQFGYSRKSKRIFQAYKNIIHTALEKGVINTDSVNRLDVKFAKKKRAATGIVNIKALMDPKNWSNPRLRLAFITSGMVGLRAGEIRGIKWMDFDPDHDAIHVVREYIDTEGEKLPKWEKTRTTTYPKELQKLLEPLRGAPDDRVFQISKRGPLSYTKLRDAMNEAVEKAEIPRITTHGLRHSIQTALRGMGVNPELLRATFGWVDEETQEGYTHPELYDLTSQRDITDTLFEDLTGKEKEKNHGKASRIHKKPVRRGRTARHY